MKLHRILVTVLLIIGLTPFSVNALTPLADDDPKLSGRKKSSYQSSKQEPRKTVKTTRRTGTSSKKTKSTSAKPSESLPVAEKTITPKHLKQDEKQPSKDWIPDIGKLYLKENQSSKDRKQIFYLIESNLGINTDGTLNLIKTREAFAELKEYNDSPDKPFSNIYFDDKLNITGYNYIYFELCTLYKASQASRFKRYFEKGFYPNRSLFIKEEYYYKALYYYLYIIQDSLVSKITNATQELSKTPGKAPSFSNADITTFDTAVKVSAELDEFRIKGKKVADSPYEKIFSADEREWINATVQYFTDIETHLALYSYPWFRANIPLSVSAQVIAHDIRETWIDQTISHRAMLPLMLFTNDGDLQFSVEHLFASTLNKLKLDNREVDVVVMSALKTWLRKQIEHGINVEDRIKYKLILDELEVCPSGWIFYNLYSCKKPLEELKSYATKWDSYSQKQKTHIFNTKITYTYAEALQRINLVFSDLEKMFGKVQVFGREQKSSSINYIFHKYRGEIDYYYEYLQFGMYENNLSTIRFPLANSNKNCLFDFKAAFVKASDKAINHKNLLRAYTLLFKELASQGKLSDIMKYEEELETFINNENYQLGSILIHTDDDRYEIYKLIANSYLSNKELQARALKVAERSYLLSRKYYVAAAEDAGYIQDGIPGALNNNSTEIDDFERQFEFYQEIAKKLGKKIWLLVPNNDVQLYNRLQDLRNPEGFLL